MHLPRARARHLRHGRRDPELLTDLFGIDLERYIPEVVLTIGKSTGPTTERYRYTGDHFIIWG